MMDGSDKAPLPDRAAIQASPHGSGGARRGLQNPAADAAGLLLRLGFGIFALVIPSAALMSRWVFVVLVPIGAVLIILASLLRDEETSPAAILAGLVRSDAGLLALFFALWACLSLFWTPFPAEAGEKLFKTLGVVMLGFMAAISLPPRMRASNLHLITLGMVLGALLLIWGALAERLSLDILRFPAATPGRVAVLLSILSWSAIAWMLIINRRVMAGVIGLLVGFALVFGGHAGVHAPLVSGLVVFIVAWFFPIRGGNVLAAFAGVMVAGGPLLAGLAKGAASAFSLPPAHILSRIGVWWDALMLSPVHFLTGRGFDASNAARAAGLTPLDASIGFISDLWLELGLLGAVSFAALLVLMFRRAGQMGGELGPAALAGLAAALAYALLEQGATQTWWLNGMVVFALVLMAVERGRYRAVRPRAILPSDRADSPE